MPLAQTIISTYISPTEFLFLTIPEELIRVVNSLESKTTACYIIYFILLLLLLFNIFMTF